MADAGSVGSGNIEHQAHDDGDEHKGGLSGQKAEGEMATPDQAIDGQPGGNDGDVQRHHAPPADDRKDYSPAQTNGRYGQRAIAISNDHSG